MWGKGRVHTANLIIIINFKLGGLPTASTNLLLLIVTAAPVCHARLNPSISVFIL